MDRKEAKNFLPILQAFAEGKQIQIIGLRGTWEDLPDSVLNFEAIKADEVRIKPEPKYRPFANAEECWNEMLKHQPFGWVKDKEDGYYSLITCVDDKVCLNANNGWSMNGTMDNFTFADGSVFGVKEEE